MAKNTQKDSWLLLTFSVLVIVFALFFSFLFPKEAFALVQQYIYFAIPSIITMFLLMFHIRYFSRFKVRQQQKKLDNRNKHIKLAEQLIWRSRYSLEAQKGQIYDGNDAESMEKWQQAKKEYIISKLYPVVSEQEVPIKVASALIENSLSGTRFRSGRLPTYGVTDLE